MSAGIYNPSSVTMNDYQKGPNSITIPKLSTQPHYSASSTSDINPDSKWILVNNRAMQEAQLAMEREYAKQIKLDQFQKKTKLAAKSYKNIMKTEEQIKQEIQKQETEGK